MSAMLEWALGQSADGTAKAGPDAIASERLSQIRARMRRMALKGIREGRLRGNAHHHWRPFTSRITILPASVAVLARFEAKRPGTFKEICGASPVRCAQRHNVLGNAADLASHFIAEPRTRVTA
jgi:hypothetical protein